MGDLSRFHRQASWLSHCTYAGMTILRETTLKFILLRLSNGSVTGQTARQVKPDESLSVVFTPSAGFRLAEVKGTCEGALQGNVFDVLPTNVDCLIEPTFYTGNEVLERHCALHLKSP